jgi:hypothetical protein
LKRGCFKKKGFEKSLFFLLKTINFTKKKKIFIRNNRQN